MRTYTTQCTKIGVLISFLLLGGVFAPIGWNDVVWAEEEGGDDHEEEGLELSPDEIEEFGIQVATASSGWLGSNITIPGEINVNPNLLAHIVPRVPGVVSQVRANIGDRVDMGQLLAVLESRELSELKSAYLIAKERLHLAQTTFSREEKLWKQNISSEREYLEAQQELAEIRIDLKGVEQKFHALGFSKDYLVNLSFDNEEQFTRYEIVAPFDGTIIDKHIVSGEVVKDELEAFAIADLRSVWVKLTAYQKHLPFLQVGQVVHIESGQGNTTTGEVAYVSPIIDEKTRTAIVRIVLSNKEGVWRPGSFVTATIEVDRVEVSLLVPKSAIQTLEDQSVVFVEMPEGFEPQPIEVGRTNRTHAEILSGLQSGQRYAAQGAFTLKAQLSKGAFGDGDDD